MNIEQAKHIPIASYLSREGYQPKRVRHGGTELWYHSPLRKGDDTPSFKVDVLVKAGIPIDQRTLTDVTALMFASAVNRNLEVAARLAELGADTAAFDPDGKTPLRLVQDRIEGDGKGYASISDEMDQKTLEMLQF